MMAFARGPRPLAPGFHTGFGGIGAAMGLFFLLAVVAVVVVLLVIATKRSHRLTVGGYGHAPGAVLTTDQAVRIVRERLARGEIDAEEYNRIVSALNGTTVPPTSS